MKFKGISGLRRCSGALRSVRPPGNPENESLERERERESCEEEKRECSQFSAYQKTQTKKTRKEFSVYCV